MSGPPAIGRESGMSDGKPFLSVLAGERIDPPPVWLMRQAGRYLPEYRATRAEAGSFLQLCFSPERACEVTLQPLRRYGFDAAILFSDILVVPYALGQTVEFAEGEGPRLDPIRDLGGLAILDPGGLHEKAAPVYETVRLLRRALAEHHPDTALIGFAGAPWTVACYMVEGGGSKDFAKVKTWAFTDPDGFGELIDLLTAATVDYLSAQVEAGAEVVQVFDTWAGVLPAREVETWVVAPTRRIVQELAQRHPNVPVIGFPRAIGALLPWYAAETGVRGLSLDPGVPLDWAAREVPRHVALQGNLDPLLLLAGGDALRRGVASIRQALSERPHIFNLGHGIVKETPPENVDLLVRSLRGD